MMSDGDNNGQMIFGDLGGPKASRHLSYRRGKTPKKPVPTGDRTRARCVTGAHAVAWPTEVDALSQFSLSCELHFLKEVVHLQISEYVMRDHGAPSGIYDNIYTQN